MEQREWLAIVARWAVIVALGMFWVAVWRLI